MGSVAPAGGRLVDATFVVVLSALGLLPLASSFAGAGWAVVGAIAVLVGVALAERVAAWNWPGSGLALAAFVAFVVLAGPAPSLNRPLGEMVPTPSVMSEIFRNTVRCWGDLIGTLPRVDSSGPVMLIPLVLGLFPATIAMGTAAMTRSAGLPVVPLAGMLAAALALGRGETTWQVPTGVAFAVLALWWVSVRGRRFDAHLAHPGFRQALSALVVLAVAGSLAPHLAGRVAGDTGRLVLRDTVARGFDTRDIDTPLRAFRRFTRQGPDVPGNVHRRTLLKVTGLPAGHRLRFAVLDWYDGEQWRPNPDRSPVDSRARYLRLSSTIDNPSPGRSYEVTVDVRRPWRSNWVPTAGALQSFEFRSFESGDRRDALVYNPETRAALLGMTLRGVDDYDFGARIAPDTLTRDMTAATGVDESQYVRASYLDEIAVAWQQRTETPMQALFAAAADLRKKGRYSDGATPWEDRRYPAGHGIDRLDQQFVHAQQMVGNDEQYAATMALLAIRLGIPARVVVGAVNPRSGVIRGRNVQAWIEVQVADGSWRTLPTERFMSHKPPKRKVSGQLRPTSVWQPPPPPRNPNQPQQQPEPPKTKPERQPERPADDGDAGWWLLVLAALTAGVPTTKAVRRWRRRQRARPSAAIAGAWDELVDAARDLGAEWAHGLTRPQEARALGLPVELADSADLLVFAAPEPEPEQVQDYWRQGTRVRHELSRSAPWWRRVLAPVNPITLIRRR